METAKRIGILTSGGDCPGLNAVIRAVVKCAIHRGWQVYGIPHGTDGLVGLCAGLCQPEDLKLKENGYDIPGIVQGLDILQFLSGSILGSLSKGNPNQEEIAKRILKGYEILDLDALVVVGGDGSLDIIYDLAQKGYWAVVAIPKTIDNDVPFTERSVGFDTAVGTVTRALYDLTFTAASHDRVMVVQVMGRDAGHLALHAGIAGGADVILIPELVPALSEAILQEICDRIAHLRQSGRKFALVVISEGIKTLEGTKAKYVGDYLAEQIRDRSHQLCQTGERQFCDMDQVDTRSTTLGHIQRSGTPSSVDRLLATAFGAKAVSLIAQGLTNRLVIWKSGQVQSIPLDQVIPTIRQCHLEDRCAGPVQADDLMVDVARSLGIYLGPSHAIPSANGAAPLEAIVPSPALTTTAVGNTVA
ncbi:MAG: ATP-dependent 6-phosphofructokinase [Elainellaceae cyanobacterium]